MATKENKERKLEAFINTVSVVWILLAAAVSVMIFATNNSYSEPVFGDIMLVSTGSDRSDDIKEGSLAVVELNNKDAADYYAAFVGGGVNITKDKMASVGAVKYFIPVMGRVVDFFRTPVGFFLVVILPLAVFVIYQTIKIIVLVKYGGKE